VRQVYTRSDGRAVPNAEIGDETVDIPVVVQGLLAEIASE
jgi:hypothetical protein